MKIKRIVTLLTVAATVSAASSSCTQLAREFVGDEVTASGPVVRQERKIGSVKELSVSTGMSVRYVQSDSMKVIVEAPQSVIDLVATKEKKGELSIYLSKRVRTDGNGINVVVMAPMVVDFNASAGVGLTIADGYNAGGKDVEIDVSSGASVSAVAISSGSLDVECSSGATAALGGINVNDVKGEVSSGAALTMAGKAVRARYSASSGGALDASQLRADNGGASASSGGSVSSNIRNATVSQSSGGIVRN